MQLFGKQVVGFCVLVTAVLFYLMHVKNNLFIPGIVSSPAKYLNQILVNIDNKEIPNNPRYVRNKRNYFKAIRNKENYPTSSSDSEISSDDFVNEDKNVKKILKNKNIILVKKSILKSEIITIISHLIITQLIINYKITQD